MSDRIFKLTRIHASVIYPIPWIRWIHWISVQLMENSNVSGQVSQIPTLNNPHLVTKICNTNKFE